MDLKLIVGLGNPGPLYDQTPHNLGFAVVDALAISLKTGAFSQEKQFQSLQVKHDNLLLVKPQTYMNKSGDCVAALAHYYKIKPANIFVIHDEADLPFGQLRISQGKGPGTHNGVRSVRTSLGSDDFVRFRLGIQLPNIQDLERYVLSPIPQSYRQQADALIAKTAGSLLMAINQKVTIAMNFYNTALASE